MNKVILMMVLALASARVWGHADHLASVTFSPVNDIWVAELRMSKQGANQALAEYYADVDWKSISQNKFKKYLVDYVKRNTDLQVDHKQIALGAGGIKFDSPMAEMKFVLPHFPLDFKSLQLKIDVLSENRNQHTVVRFENGDKHLRKVLNAKNDFKMLLANTESAYFSQD